MTQLKVLVLTCCLLTGLQAFAQHGLDTLPDELTNRYESVAAEVREDADALERVIEAGRERAVFCNTCHGPDGSAQRPNYPSLAAQNPVYLLDQIEQFADGSRKKLVMNVLAETFSVEEKINLALYYAHMELEPAEFDEELARRGAQAYQARCAQCHGASGLGEAGYARIAGQQPEYIAEVLREYRSGNSPRRLSVMYGISAGLSEQDIEAVAHYAASLQRQ